MLSEDISAGSIGLLLAIPAFLYAIFSPLSGILAESYGCKQTMFFGMVLLLVTYLLFGPFPYLTELFGLASYTKGMWTDQVLSLVLLGIGAAFAFVPSLPDMQKSVEEMGPEATNAIAGYFNGVYCLGEAAGPILAGLKQFMPFPYVCKSKHTHTHTHIPLNFVFFLAFFRNDSFDPIILTSMRVIHFHTQVL